MFLAGSFLLVSSATFAVGCIGIVFLQNAVTKQNAENNSQAV